MEPDLCVVCANNAALLALPSFLARVVALLRLRSPPAGLWGHILGPGGALAQGGGEGEGEGEWGALSEAPLPHALVILAPHQLPDALHDILAGAVAAAAAAGGAAAGGGGGGAAAFVGLDGGAVHGSLPLASLQTALWVTLQATCSSPTPTVPEPTLPYPHVTRTHPYPHGTRTHRCRLTCSTCFGRSRAGRQSRRRSGGASP